MADEKPVVFDDDNPEWTDEDFARAKAGEDILSDFETGTQDRLDAASTAV